MRIETRHAPNPCKRAEFASKNRSHERKRWRACATLRYKTPTCSPLSSQSILEGHPCRERDGWEVRGMPAKKKAAAATKPAAKKVAAKKPAAKKAAAKKK